MRKLLLCALLCLSVTAIFAAKTKVPPAPEVSIEINGMEPDMVKLSGNGKGLEVFHPGWLKGEKRACFLAVASKPLTDNWQEFSFSFIPEKTGTVIFSLKGKPYRLENKKFAKIYTIYDDFKVEGATLKNPDFENIDDHGNFTGWNSRWGLQPYQTNLGDSAKVYAGNRLYQNIKVAKGQKVTVSFKAKSGGIDQGGDEQNKDNVSEKAKSSSSQKASVDSDSEREGRWPANWAPSYEKIDLAKIKIEQSNVKDYSAEIQRKLDAGEKEIKLADGTYRITFLKIPTGVTLSGTNNTVILLDTPGDAGKPVIELKGNNITLKNLTFKLHDAVLMEALKVKRFTMIKGENLSNILISRVNYINSKKQFRWLRAAVAQKTQAGRRIRVKLTRWNLIQLTNCKDIEAEHCRFENFSSGIMATQCFRVSFHDNVGVNGLHNMMRFYNGSEFFKFYNNWFSHVKHPMVWDGGDCSPHNKELKPSGAKAASTVYRTMRLGDANYAQHMTGTYEVICYGNYAEYGKTLAWGRKGRRVIISSNSSRYMYDMAFDAEGCEEVIFANNIAVNSKAAGMGAFYYNNSTLITGNIVVIEDKGDEIYKGQFVRLHSSHGTFSSKTIITGNLFINRLKEPRFVRLDYTDDVTISNNKFVNGGIKSNRYVGGNAIITGNSFISTLPRQESLVQVGRLNSMITFRNNTMENRNPVAVAEAPAIDFQLANKASDQDGKPTLPLMRQVDGNSIRGWAVPIKAYGPGAKSADIIFCNNIYEGKPELPSGKNVINKNNTYIGK